MKILVYTGYGLGWSSWVETTKQKKFALHYAPIIEAIERGEVLSELHSSIVSFIKDYAKAFKGDSFRVYRPEKLEVLEVDKPFRIDSYDGFESIVLLEEEEYITPWMDAEEGFVLR